MAEWLTQASQEFNPHPSHQQLSRCGPLPPPKSISQMVDTSSRAISQVAGGAGGISQKILRAISGGLSNVGSDLREVDFSARAKSVLEQLPSLGRNLASGALTVAETVLSILRRLSAGSVFADGRSNPNADLEAAAAAVAVGVAMAGGAATFGRGGNSGSGGGNSGIVEEGRGVGGSGGEDEGRRLQPIGGSVAGGGGASQGEERMLQPVGVKLETGAAPSEGEVWRFDSPNEFVFLLCGLSGSLFLLRSKGDTDRKQGGRRRSCCTVCEDKSGPCVSPSAEGVRSCACHRLESLLRHLDFFSGFMVLVSRQKKRGNDGMQHSAVPLSPVVDAFEGVSRGCNGVVLPRSRNSCTTLAKPTLRRFGSIWADLHFPRIWAVPVVHSPRLFVFFRDS